MTDFDKTVELVKPIGVTESYLFESLKDEEESAIFMRREGVLLNGDVATVNITIDNPEGSGVIRFYGKQPLNAEQDKQERIEFDKKEYGRLYQDYQKIMIGIQDVKRDEPIRFLWNDNKLTTLYSVIFINGGEGCYYAMLVSDKIYNNNLRMKFLKFYVTDGGKIETIKATANKNVHRQLANAFQTILDGKAISMLPIAPVITRVREEIISNGQRQKEAEDIEIKFNDISIKLGSEEEDDE